MLFSSLFVAFSLSMSANAFVVYDNDRAKSVGGSNDACVKALSTDLDCNPYIEQFWVTGWQGSIKGKALTDDICRQTCHDSLREWYTRVARDCKGQKRLGGDMFSGWKQLCDKDARTGKYCNDIIDEQEEIDEDEEFPLKYLCEPCYIRRMFIFDWSEYSPSLGWLEKQRARIHKECPKSVQPEITASLVTEEAVKTAEPTSVTAKASNSADGTTAAPESTASPTTTLSTEATTSPQSNAAEKLRQGRLGGAWYLVFILGMNIILL